MGLPSWVREQPGPREARGSVLAEHLFQVPCIHCSCEDIPGSTRCEPGDGWKDPTSSRRPRLELAIVCFS
eukprot:2884629-Amphidinium_carterae.1